MSYYANSEQRDRLIAGLRELAEFLDQNPQVPAPSLYRSACVPAIGRPTRRCSRKST